LPAFYKSGANVGASKNSGSMTPWLPYKCHCKKWWLW